MYLQERKFNKFVSTQKIVAHVVYGSAFSIQLSLKEVQEQKLSTILAKYVNEQKAQIDGDYAYIVPEYHSYNIKTKSYKKQRLLQLVSEKNFITMINQAEIVLEKINDDTDKLQYYLKLGQAQAKKYQCVLIISFLIDANLAKIKESNNDIYIQYNFRQALEKSSKIQSDLSHFRTLLGESNNLAAIFELIELGQIRKDKIFIKTQDVQDSELQVELLSLHNLEIAKIVADGYEIETQFASWLLEYVTNTSDRISFANMYGD